MAKIILAIVFLMLLSIAPHAVGRLFEFCLVLGFLFVFFETLTGGSFAKLISKWLVSWEMRSYKKDLEHTQKEIFSRHRKALTLAPLVQLWVNKVRDGACSPEESARVLRCAVSLIAKEGESTQEKDLLHKPLPYREEYRQFLEWVRSFGDPATLDRAFAKVLLDGVKRRIPDDAKAQVLVLKHSTEIPYDEKKITPQGLEMLEHYRRHLLKAAPRKMPDQHNARGASSSVKSTG